MTSSSGARRAWFGDYGVGDVIESPARMLYREDVLAYVRFTNDTRVILGVDVGEILEVPRMFLFSLSVGLLLHADETYIPEHFVAFQGFHEVTFHERATTGQIISATASVVEVRERASTGSIRFAHEARTRDGSLLVASQHSILVRKAPEQC